jgi:cell division protein ZapA
MAQVNLTVNGRVYRMACQDGEEDHVMELGDRFNAAINELRGAMGEIGDQRLMVMAGILMTDRLDDAEQRLRKSEQEIQSLRDRNANTAMRVEAIEERFADNLHRAAERIEELTERLYGARRVAAGAE